MYLYKQQYFILLYVILYVNSFLLTLVYYSLPAQAESFSVLPDGTTQTEIEGGIDCTADCFISGSSRLGSSLFHSFSEFNIPDNVTVTFKDGGATNIFTRVLGNASTINGTLAITGAGQANFFLLNPNGIIFGPNAALQSVGSFVMNTAESIIFSEGVEFGTHSSALPQLTISTPIGLQFGSQPKSIVNQSQASPAGAINSLGAPVGLRVSEGETLALIGSGVYLEGGNLTANSGQITIGSVSANSRVSLSPELELGYEDTFAFQDIDLTQTAFVDVSGSSGMIFMQGRNISAKDSSGIINQTSGNSSGGSIELIATESINMTNSLVVFSPLVGSTSDGSDLNIWAKRLTLNEGAVITGGTFGVGGNGGTLTINASESVDLSGHSDFIPSLITTSTQGLGAGGNIIINTRRLTIADGAQIQSVTYGPGDGGSIAIHATERVDVSGFAEIPFRGPSIRLVSGIFASSGLEGLPFQPTGKGGSLTINTDSFSINEGARVAVSSLGSGNSGDLTVHARAVRLDSGAQLTTAAIFGNAGNLRLANLETLVLRQGSVISTRAGLGDGQGNGGNIDIESDFIVAGLLEDNDIVAKATAGRGGNIEIATQGLYGFEERSAIAQNGTNDIDASSEFGLSGTTEINQLTAENNIELTTQTPTVLETSADVNKQCDATGNRFVVTGRGGIPVRPSHIADIGTPLVDLGAGHEMPLRSESLRSESLPPEEDDFAAQAQTGKPNSLDHRLNQSPTWIEASGWTTNAQNQVVLTAPPQNRAFSQQTAAQCTS